MRKRIGIVVTSALWASVSSVPIPAVHLARRTPDDGLRALERLDNEQLRQKRRCRAPDTA
jgi:hypothetical protein